MSAARALIALSLCSGCVEHLSIDAIAVLDDDAGTIVDATQPLDSSVRDARVPGPVDASPVQDADSPSDASFGLSLRMRAFGRDDITNLVGGCGSCIDVEAIPLGGVPPYRVEWWDARTEPKRRYCTSEGGTSPFLAPAVSVTDALGAREEVPLTVFLTIPPEGCAPDAEPTPWQVCIAPPSLAEPNCPEPQLSGSWFQLGQPLQNVETSVFASWSGPILFPTRMVVGVRAQPCAEPVIVSDRIVGLFDMPFSLPAPYGVDSVLVQFPNEVGGYPPLGVGISVGGLCFNSP